MNVMLLARRFGAAYPVPAMQNGRQTLERADPIRILEDANKTRLQNLVPIRFGRMSMSAFAFYRGTADIMAYDLSKTPVSGIQAQLCGDAHISNFGVYASPERRQVFDVNDFVHCLSRNLTLRASRNTLFADYCCVSNQLTAPPISPH